MRKRHALQLVERVRPGPDIFHAIGQPRAKFSHDVGKVQCALFADAQNATLWIGGKRKEKDRRKEREVSMIDFSYT